MAPAKKASTKKAASKKKAAAKKAPAKKAAAKKASAKKSAAKKAPAKKASANKTASAKKSTSTTAKKTAAKKAAKNPPKKAVTKTKSPFDKKFLDEQKALLLEERSKYIQSAETLKAEADSLIEGREPGDVDFGEEGGEGDTLAVERERDLALSGYARKAVEEIDEALERLREGSYGICVISGKPIPKERLRAIPWAAERVEYKAGGFGTRR